MGCPHNFKGDAINTQNLQQNSLKLDYYFYSCFEVEQTCKAFPDRGLSEQRWPEAVKMLESAKPQTLAEGEEPAPPYIPAGEFIDLLDQAFAWYEQQFPELKGEAKIEFDNVGAISTASAFMALDMKLLAKFDLDRLASFRDASSPIWADIHRVVEAHAGNFVQYLKAYLRWSFVKAEEKIWEAGDRPPVGRYTPGARRGGSRPFSGGSGSGPRRSGPPGGGRDRDRGPRREMGDKGPRGGRDGGRDRDRPREDRGDKGRSRPPRNEARGGASHADQEQAAIETVKVALEKLREDTTLAEVRLDPANSFFRRLQHKKAVSDGFFSYSTGEGSGRSVVVTRDKPANEDSE